MPRRPHEIRVRNLTELMKALYADSWQPGIRRFRSHYAFRGLSRSAYRLEGSLMRLGRHHAQIEEAMFRNFKKYAQLPPGAAPTTDWGWLALAQHHGLPTRLMDWTYSPFVAMHFVTAAMDRFNQDGAVWCVDYRAVNRLLPENFTNLMRVEKATVFTIDMLDRTRMTLAEFRARPGDPLVVFLEPPSLDDRIVNQYALFSAMSGAQRAFSTWLAERPGLYFKVIISSKLKWDVRDMLDQANITERMLFPGLDGLAGWLTRHYRPGDPRRRRSPSAGW